MKCEICGKEILKDSQCIDYKYYHNNCIKKLQSDNERLKNNWNELKEYMKTIYKSCPPYEKEVVMFIINKIQELENKEDNND